jgi:N-acyl amino acid synthase of PEP-CTERM/exosortase system
MREDATPGDGESFIGGYLRGLQQQAFHHAYYKTFAVVRADDDEHKRQVFELRYQVYCAENAFIDPSECPGRIERDAYDGKAVHHLLIHRDSGQPVGTIRLSLPDKDAPGQSFEMQKLCDHPLLQIESRVLNMAEISRFCMAPHFRRRPRDGHLLPAYYEQEDGGPEDAEGGVGFRRPLFRRRIPYAPLGLMMASFETMLENGITNCITMMETRQFQTLKSLGLNWRVLGPRLPMHGMQQPLIFNIKAVLDNMREVNPPCWEILSDKGRLHSRADQLYQYDWQDSVFDEACRELIVKKLL